MPYHHACNTESKPHFNADSSEVSIRLGATRDGSIDKYCCYLQKVTRSIKQIEISPIRYLSQDRFRRLNKSEEKLQTECQFTIRIANLFSVSRNHESSKLVYT